MMQETAQKLGRRRLVAEVLRQRGPALVVAGLGTPAWDVAAAGGAAGDYCLWGGMGLACPIGLGLALARSERRVLVVTGDGELLMGLGSLATIAAQRPGNLAVLVLDNERFAETGGQTGLTAAGCDITGIARSAGFAAVRTVASHADAAGLAAFLFAEPGPVLALAKVADTRDPPVYPCMDGAALTARFRAALGVDDGGC